MSLKEFQDDLNNIIKPQLEEILRVLKNQQYNDNIEAAAAKIINEVRTIIHNCPCNKEILNVLKTGTSSKEIIIPDEKFKKLETPGNLPFSPFDKLP